MGLLIVICSLCLFTGLSKGSPTPSENFTHSAILVNPDVYHVYWKFDATSITFELHVKTTGYVGFGITPNGQMAGSDMIVGWVKDGVTYFKDRYAKSQTAPAIDPSQDWNLLSGSEAGGYTMLKFNRSLTNCDSNDLDITSGTMRLIYSYKDTDPTSEQSLVYHGATQRGTKSIWLLGDQAKQTVPLPSNAQYFDLLNPNVSVPNTDTTYWCKGFKIPNLGGKRHVIMIEPIVQAGHEALVHHILIYGCYHQVNDSVADHQGHICYTRNMPGDLYKCTNTLFAWAIGGGKFYFPSHAGFPLGTSEDPTFLRMETHYDNPQLRNDYVDASGLRIWYTPTLRTYDSGILVTGVNVGPDHIIPPKSNQFISKGFCSSTCMTQAFGQSLSSGINVFATALHTHLAGTGVKVSVIRNGKELPALDEDLSYDFNFQEARHLTSEVNVLPTDDLIVDCYYKTAAKAQYTKGGIKTTDEMCLAFLMYYPRVNLTDCQSSPSLAQSLTIGGKLNYQSSGAYPYHVITTDGAYKNKNLFDVVSAVDWTRQSNQDTFQALVTTGQISAVCQTTEIKYPLNGQTVNRPTVTTPYVAPPSECSSAPIYVSACPLLAAILITLATLLYA